MISWEKSEKPNQAILDLKFYVQLNRKEVSRHEKCTDLFNVLVALWIFITIHNHEDKLINRFKRPEQTLIEGNESALIVVSLSKTYFSLWIFSCTPFCVPYLSNDFICFFRSFYKWNCYVSGLIVVCTVLV